MALPDYNKFGFIPGFNTMLALITLVHRWPETVDREGGYLQSLQGVNLSPKIFSNWKPVNAGIPQGTKL